MTEEELDYHVQREKNEVVFKDALKLVRPDIWLLMDIIDATGINATVLWRIAQGLNNIATSTGYGQVVAEIEDRNVRFVRSNVADKINEPLLKPITSEPKNSDL